MKISQKFTLCLFIATIYNSMYGMQDESSIFDSLLDSFHQTFYYNDYVRQESTKRWLHRNKLDNAQSELYLTESMNAATNTNTTATTSAINTVTAAPIILSNQPCCSSSCQW